MAVLKTRVGGRQTVQPVTRSVSSVSTMRTKPPVKPNEIDLTLPTKKTKPTGSLHSAKILLHGEPGIGKTELTTYFPENLSTFFEPGGEFLEILRIPLVGQFTHWKQFVKVVDRIEKSDMYGTITLDTVDFAWDLCGKWIIENADDNPTDINDGSLGFDRGNKKLLAEFKHQVMRLTATGRGVIFVSHTISKEMQKVTGVKNDKLIATVSDKGRRFLNGFCDLTICYAYSGDERHLIIRGDENVDAKCRMPYNFNTPSGEQIWSIPAGDSAEEAYANILTAYNNQQDDPGRLRRRVEMSEVKAKFEIKKRR